MRFLIYTMVLTLFFTSCSVKIEDNTKDKATTSDVKNVKDVPQDPSSNISALFVLSSEIKKSVSIKMEVAGASKYRVPNLPSWISLNEKTGELVMKSDGSVIGHQLYDLIVTKDSKDITIANALRVSLYRPYSTLKSRLKLEKPVETTKTGASNKTTSFGGVYIITNADGINHTAISYYFERYNTNGRLTAIDVATNTVKSVIEESEMEGEGWNGVMMVPLGNGRAMFSFNNMGKMDVAVYDTKTHTWDRHIVTSPPTHRINLPNAMTYSTGGMVFTLGVNPHDGTAHPTLLRIDPNTYETHFYGNIGEGGWFGQQVVADKTYVYVLTGRVPYRITQVRISDGEQKSIATGDDLWLRQYKGGVLIGYGGKSYFMHKGKQYEILKGQTSVDAPWPKVKGECARRTCYNVDYDQKFISASDSSSAIPLSGTDVGNYWYQDEYKGKWKKITTPNIPLYSVSLIDMKVLPEISKVFYAADRYAGYVLQDIDDKSFKAYNPVDGGLSYYANDYSYPYLTFTGYPNGQTLVYDVRKPWDNTLPGINYHPDKKVKVTNPKNIGHMNLVSENHKNYAVTTGQDGLLYFGGRWMRFGVGGGVEWYNMETNEHGGIREGFEDVWITQMKAFGKYIALGCSKISGSSAFEIRMLNTQTKKIDYVIVPDKDISRVGLWAKGSDENLFISTRSKVGNAAIMNINVIKNKIIYNRDLGLATNVGKLSNEKDNASIFVKDGFVYMNTNSTLILRIEPNTGDAEIATRYVGKSGKITAYKDTLYISGKETQEIPLKMKYGFEKTDKRKIVDITSVSKGDDNIVFKTTSTKPFDVEVSLKETGTAEYKNAFFYDNTSVDDNSKITLVMTIESISGGDIIINSVEYDGRASVTVKAGETKRVELTVGVLAQNKRLRVGFGVDKMVPSTWKMKDILIKKELKELY